MNLPALGTSVILATISFVSCPRVLADTIVYNNTTTDTGDTLTYAVGPYTEIGDQIQLSGTNRYATTATVQFYNNGTEAGTFNATLTLLNTGSPVGSVIGTYAVNGISAPLGGASGFDVNFTGIDTTVPDNLVFAVSVSGESAGLNLGLDLFQPPTVGSSDDTFAIVSNGTYSDVSTADENLFFELQATTVPLNTPEPSTMVLLATALVILIALSRRHARSSQHN